MLVEDFLPEFRIGVKEGSVSKSNNAIMKQLGNYIVNKREDVVDLLNESGIPSSVTDTDSVLMNKFIDNLGKNRELTMGLAILIHWDNREYGVDGSSTDQSIKAAMNTINTYFLNPTSNFAAPDALAGAVEGVSKIGSKVIEGIQKKKYGATDALQKQQEAKAAIAQQILAQRQAQIEQIAKQQEASAKTTRIVLISVIAVVGLGIAGIIIYKIKKRS